MRNWLAWSKRRWLGATLAAVFVPLGLLLFLQYRWLTSLAEASAIADGARLTNYLDAVATKTEDYYRDQARRALYFRPDYFNEVGTARILHGFRLSSPQGVKLLFAVRFLENGKTEQAVYDPGADGSWMPDDPSVARAIQVATAPWKVLSTKGVPLTTATLSVDERDPENRILLLPIALGDECRVIGVAGMILDRDYFTEVVLKKAIVKALPQFLERKHGRNLALTVRDERGRVVFGEKRSSRVKEGEASREFPLVFTDWTITLENRSRSPEQVARSNFTLNITMSVLLALVLTVAILWTIRTVTREMRLSKMKSDFVSNVSHELRTPLASIRVFAEFLRLGRAENPAKARQYGEYIETESRRLTTLVDNILDFSKIESGAKTYDLIPADLAAVVRATVNTLRTSLAHRGIALDYEERDGGMCPIPIDADAVAQAVANLVDNAVKYSDGQAVRVEVGRRNGAIEVAVEDRGIGISPEEQPKIFDRFHRVHTGLVHDVKGAGLGLAIVSHIMQAHGGEVRVESESGRGSRFTLEFPINDEASSAPNDAAARTA